MQNISFIIDPHSIHILITFIKIFGMMSKPRREFRYMRNIGEPIEAETLPADFLARIDLCSRAEKERSLGYIQNIQLSKIA